MSTSLTARIERLEKEAATREKRVRVLEARQQVLENGVEALSFAVAEMRWRDDGSLSGLLSQKARHHLGIAVQIFGIKPPAAA